MDRAYHERGAAASSNDALISVESSTSGAISASREIGPSTSKRMTVSFDAVTTLPADQTNAIIGIAAQLVLIIMRMRKCRS